MIAHPENISSKHNPVSRHEHHRVAISVGRRRGMDDLRLEQIIQPRLDFARERDLWIRDLYALKHPGELWVSLTRSVKQFLKLCFYAVVEILIMHYQPCVICKE